MKVLFAKHIRSATTAPRYSSVFIGDEIPKTRDQPSTLPAPIQSLLIKNGIQPPPPGVKLDLSKLDYHLKLWGTTLENRLVLKGMCRQCGLI